MCRNAPQSRGTTQVSEGLDLFEHALIAVPASDGPNRSVVVAQVPIDLVVTRQATKDIEQIAGGAVRESLACSSRGIIRVRLEVGLAAAEQVAVLLVGKNGPAHNSTRCGLQLAARAASRMASAWAGFTARVER
jgi:hypothetical protein